MEGAGSHAEHTPHQDDYVREERTLSMEVCSLAQPHYSVIRIVVHHVHRWIGGLLYLVGKDLFFPGGTYDVIERAVERIESNPQVFPNDVLRVCTYFWLACANARWSSLKSLRTHGEPWAEASSCA